MIRALLASAAAAVCASSACAQIFQADSAVAGSEFSSSYDIGNAIDGSGLPPGFGSGDAHADYVQGNHWTTEAWALDAGEAWATFSFDAPVTIGTFYLWNHRSNGVASDPNYAVTLFDLVLRDGDGNVLLELRGLSAEANVPTAQEYVFGPVDGVRSVDFVILANAGSRYTGVGEVAFAAVPTPGTLGLLAAGCLVSARRRRGA